MSRGRRGHDAGETLAGGLGLAGVPTCPAAAILPAHICTVCQEHTGTLEVPQCGGQVQGSPPTGIQLLNVHLEKEVKAKPWSLPKQCLGTPPTLHLSQSHGKDRHNQLGQESGEGLAGQDRK